MGSSTDLRRALKERFLPHVVQRGFAVDQTLQPRSTVFRRRAHNCVQMLEVQWDKYGRPRFAVHFGTCPAEGLRIGGTLFAPEDTLPTWCPDRGTLHPGRGLAGRSQWFRQDRGLLDRLIGRPALRVAADVVDQLLARFPEVERYWETGDLGPHVRLWPDAADPRGDQAR